MVSRKLFRSDIMDILSEGVVYSVVPRLLPYLTLGIGFG
jgi:hypothetical protein